MKIAIIGAGNVGGALAKSFARAWELEALAYLNIMLQVTRHKVAEATNAASRPRG